MFINCENATLPLTDQTFFELKTENMLKSIIRIICMRHNEFSYVMILWNEIRTSFCSHTGIWKDCSTLRWETTPNDSLNKTLSNNAYRRLRHHPEDWTIFIQLNEDKAVSYSFCTIERIVGIKLLQWLIDTSNKSCVDME